MKNKFIKDISAFLLVAAAFTFFIISSVSDVNSEADTKIFIKCSNLEDNMSQLQNDIPRLNGVIDVEISPEVDQISISINSDEFDPNSVQKVLKKWEINFQKEWEEEIIASSEF